VELNGARETVSIGVSWPRALPAYW